MSSGEVTLVTEEGKSLIKAPYSFISSPGTKRAFVAHTDMVWTTIHPNPTNIQDVEILEDMIILSVQNQSLLEEDITCLS